MKKKDINPALLSSPNKVKYAKNPRKMRGDDKRRSYGYQKNKYKREGFDYRDADESDREESE